jgi:hypothetical protein
MKEPTMDATETLNRLPSPVSNLMAGHPSTGIAA